MWPSFDSKLMFSEPQMFSCSRSDLVTSPALIGCVLGTTPHLQLLIAWAAMLSATQQLLVFKVIFNHLAVETVNSILESHASVKLCISQWSVFSFFQAMRSVLLLLYHCLSSILQNLPSLLFGFTQCLSFASRSSASLFQWSWTTDSPWLIMVTQLSISVVSCDGH